MKTKPIQQNPPGARLSWNGPEYGLAQQAGRTGIQVSAHVPVRGHDSGVGGFLNALGLPVSGCSGVSGLFAGGCQGPEHSPADHAGSADVGRTGTELAIAGAGAALAVVAGVPADRLGAGMIGGAAVVIARGNVLHVVSVDVQDGWLSADWAVTGGTVTINW